MTTHRTAGPWTADEQNGHMGISINASGKRIATVYLNKVSSEWKWGLETFNQPENAESCANAHFIVRACNAHAGMVDQIEALQQVGRHHYDKYVELKKVNEGLVAGLKDADERLAGLMTQLKNEHHWYTGQVRIVLQAALALAEEEVSVDAR